MRVWRLNIKTRGKDPFNFCIEKGVLGVGWAIGIDDDLVTSDVFDKESKKEYPNNLSFNKAISAIKKRMSINDICWTRNSKGLYYVGIIKSDWKYSTRSGHGESNVVNFRDCEWFEVGSVDSVPGKIVNSFSVSSTVQAIHDVASIRYSKMLVNSLSKKNIYEIEVNNETNVLSLISSDDCEDLVGLYLQKQYAFYIIPSSCKKDTAGYEYVLKNSDGLTALVQVKQGYVNLHENSFLSLINENTVIYLMTTQGSCIENKEKGIYCIDPKVINDFALNNKNILSDRVRKLIDQHISQ